MAIWGDERSDTYQKEDKVEEIYRSRSQWSASGHIVGHGQLRKKKKGQVILEKEGKGKKVGWCYLAV